MIGEIPGYRYATDTIRIIGPMSPFDWEALKFNNSVSEWVTDPNNLNGFVPQMKVLDLSQAAITEIPEDALGITSVAYKNYNLRKIILPAGLKKIGNIAFQYCEALEEINIPSTIEHIGDNAFYNNNIRTIKNSLVIPRTVKYIGNQAFAGFRLTGLSFADLNEEYCIAGPGETAQERLKIGNGAFTPNLTNANTGQAGRMTEDLQIPNWVDSIGNQAFAGLYYLNTDAPVSEDITAYESTADATIKVGKNVRFIGYGAFSNNLGVTGFEFAKSDQPLTIVMYNGGGNYQNGLFARTGITEFVWPIPGRSNITVVSGAEGTPEAEGVRTLPHYICYGCRNLTKATVGYGVTNIGDYAFAGTAFTASARTGRSNLEELTLPTSLVEINKNAFQLCGGVKYVHTVDNANTVTRSTAEGLWDLRKTQLKILREYAFQSVASASTTSPPGQAMTGIRFPSTIREFYNYSLGGNTGLNGKPLYLPDGFKHTGDNGVPSTNGEYIINNANVYSGITPKWTYVPLADWDKIVY
jgi:hypothetical protein